MRLKSFGSLAFRPARARRPLRRGRYRNGRVSRHARGGRRVCRLAEGRCRCKRCRLTFGLFAGAFLALCRIEPGARLWLVKLFELGVTAGRAAVQAGLPCPTAPRAFTAPRRAIPAADRPGLPRRGVGADEGHFGGRRGGRRGAAGEAPVFGVPGRKGRVSVTAVPDVKAKTLLEGTIELVKRGSLIYTDKLKGHGALVSCGYRRPRVDHGKRFSRGKVHIDGLEGPWSFAKGKLARHHGVWPQKFPLYLFEMRLRYSHRDEDLFNLLRDALVKPVPED